METKHQQEHQKRSLYGGGVLHCRQTPPKSYFSHWLEFEEGRDKWDMGKCFLENVLLHFHYHGQRSVCTEEKKRGHLKLWEWLSFPSLLLLSMFVISWLQSTVSESCHLLLLKVVKQSVYMLRWGSSASRAKIQQGVRGWEESLEKATGHGRPHSDLLYLLGYILGILKIFTEIKST